MRLRHVPVVLGEMGPRWVASRLGYALQRRLRWPERRFPMAGWEAYRLADVAPGLVAERLVALLRDESAPRFFIDLRRRASLAGALRAAATEAGVVAVRDEMAAAREGIQDFFGGGRREVGWPPRWHVHPETGAAWPRVHWSRLPDMGGSDVKWIWEPGRFRLAYTAVRAAWLTGDPAHALTFWEVFESWRSENPPNRGPHWMCGQECAFRALAWCFALFGLLDAPATSPERVAALVEALAAHGERIEGNLGYAVAQKNNHGINEALALWTLGTLFPMLRAARRWEAVGRRTLEAEAARQVYDDGAYVQHSLNYHRLVLQGLAWALELGRRCGRPFSPRLGDRFRRATTLLHQLTDPSSGRAPNSGSNDGARLFRLDGCASGDYRPTLAVAWWVADRRRAFAAGPWDEALLWLCGEEALAAATLPPPREEVAAEVGGYYTLAAGETWGLVRCGVYRDRPAQADMLHVDLWWRGWNLVADPGTYSYNAAPPWDNALAATTAHNAVAIDGLDQMERGPRFLWFGWARGRVHTRGALDEDGRVKAFEASHDGYVRRLGVVHRRLLLLVDARLWVVLDDLAGEGRHTFSSHWLFPDAKGQRRDESSIRIDSPVGEATVSFLTLVPGARMPRLTLVEGSAETNRGWCSPTYGHRERAVSVVVEDEVALPARRLTVVSLGSSAAIEVADDARLVVALGAERIEIAWAASGAGAAGSLVRAASFSPVREAVGGEAGHR